MESNMDTIVNGNVEDNDNKVVLSREEKLQMFKDSEWTSIETKTSKEIIEVLGKLNEKVNIADQKSFFNEAKDIIVERFKSTKETQLNLFIENGGVEEDFKFIDLDFSAFNELNTNYKEKRNAHYKAIENEQNANHKLRKELIEQIKNVVDNSQDLQFSDFSKINDQWKSIGKIPSSAVEDIFKTYQHHVERFFDLLSLNRDLRDIEFNRNLKFKEELCIKAEALLQEEDAFLAVNKLQELHKLWKEQGGPVQKEKREEIWEKFNSFTSVIHDKRQAAQDKIQEEMNQNFELKMAIVEGLKSVDLNSISTHSDWKAQVAKIDEARTSWKGIGRVSKDQNTTSWEAFKEVIKTINTAKNDYYKEFKQRQKDALKIKYDLLARAEEIKDSEDWKATADELKALQVKWKTTPRPLVNDADKVWEKFRGACNHFFERRKAQFEIQAGDMKENLVKKIAVLDELKGISLSDDDHRANFNLLKSFNDKWKACGKISKSDHENYDGQFRSLMDSYFNQLKLDEKNKHEMLLKMKLEGFVESQDFDKIKYERKSIVRKIDTTYSDIKTYDANLAWIKGSDDHPIKKDILKKIQRSKDSIKSLKDQLNIVDDLLKNN